MDGLTALDAARALVDALGLRYGEVTVQVAGGDVRLVRLGRTYTAADLSEFSPKPTEAADPEPPAG